MRKAFVRTEADWLDPLLAAPLFELLREPEAARLAPASVPTFERLLPVGLLTADATEPPGAGKGIAVAVSDSPLSVVIGAGAERLSSRISVQTEPLVTGTFGYR